MEYVDLRGMTCPQPVLETKRLIESRKPHELSVLVDNGPPRENVTRFLESRGYCVTVEETKPDEAVLRAARTEESEEASAPAQKKIVVMVDGATIGRGDDLLGSVLMKSFLHTLKEIKPLPWRLIFINAGVKLAAEGSDVVGVLNELEKLDIEILSCGTCLDFFHLKDKVSAGKITNMYEIVSSLIAATNVLRP